MWNWLTYLLTMVTALMLVVSGSVCCTAAMAMDLSHPVGSEVVEAGEKKSGCGCSQGESEESGEPGCCAGCDGIGENTRSVDVENVAAALVTDNTLDGFELPVLQPRFQALLAVWFADFLEPFEVRESASVARFVDPGPPAVDVPIYLQVQNLRL